jgi:hypothetical protein
MTLRQCQGQNPNSFYGDVQHDNCTDYGLSRSSRADARSDRQRGQHTTLHAGGGVLAAITQATLKLIMINFV